MSHVVRELPWGVVDIVEDEGRVFFQQRWAYTWSVVPPLTLWSLAEQRDFHNLVDRQIWGSWSNRVQLNVAGATPFARRYLGSGVSINFDVRRVTKDEHWNVAAWKQTGFQRSWVDFANRKMTLYANDTAPRGACNNSVPAVCQPGFRTMPHEFGHAIGPDDEYTTTSPHLADTNSLLNIGTQLRDRHFDLVLTELNRMIPGCTFSVRSLK